MAVYYNKAGIIVKDSTPLDLSHLAQNMRQSDEDEIWASNQKSPLEALKQSYAESSICMTIHGEKPIAIFGVAHPHFVSSQAVIWFLSTDELKRIQLEFIRHSKSFVQYCLVHYPLLYNYVDARNIVSLAWLRRIGATIKDAEPYGPYNLPFHYFEFRR